MLHDICQNEFTYENKHKHTNTDKYTIKKSFVYQYLTKSPLRNSHCPKYCQLIPSGLNLMVHTVCCMQSTDEKQDKGNSIKEIYFLYDAVILFRYFGCIVMYRTFVKPNNIIFKFITDLTAFCIFFNVYI